MQLFQLKVESSVYLCLVSSELQEIPRSLDRFELGEVLLPLVKELLVILKFMIRSFPKFQN